MGLTWHESSEPAAAPVTGSRQRSLCRPQQMLLVHADVYLQRSSSETSARNEARLPPCCYRGGKQLQPVAGAVLWYGRLCDSD